MIIQLRGVNTDIALRHGTRVSSRVHTLAGRVRLDHPALKILEHLRGQLVENLPLEPCRALPEIGKRHKLHIVPLLRLPVWRRQGRVVRIENFHFFLEGGDVYLVINLYILKSNFSARNNNSNINSVVLNKSNFSSTKNREQKKSLKPSTDLWGAIIIIWGAIFFF